MKLCMCILYHRKINYTRCKYEFSKLICAMLHEKVNATIVSKTQACTMNSRFEYTL